MPSSPAERRKIYLKRKKSGCCPRCGQKIKKNSKFTFCDSCRLFFRGYFNEVSDEINEMRKARYNNRKKNNLCPRCGAPLGKKYTKTICQKCLDKQYGYNGAKRRSKLKAVTNAKLISGGVKKKIVSKPKTKKK
jgi:Zn finger protein HypA/HybF involved in hydrogenase expression